mmetsp:Transcript_20683/g.39308  ORF Transcript_20683/g.39308 Transcript_20683/m.39308 type:complete len:314 (+) Transcript_20683:750-1691(+)
MLMACQVHGQLHAMAPESLSIGNPKPGVPLRRRLSPLQVARHAVQRACKALLQASPHREVSLGMAPDDQGSAEPLVRGGVRARLADVALRSRVCCRPFISQQLQLRRVLFSQGLGNLHGSCFCRHLVLDHSSHQVRVPGLQPGVVGAALVHRGARGGRQHLPPHQQVRALDRQRRYEKFGASLRLLLVKAVQSAEGAQDVRVPRARTQPIHEAVETLPASLRRRQYVHVGAEHVPVHVAVGGSLVWVRARLHALHRVVQQALHVRAPGVANGLPAGCKRKVLVSNRVRHLVGKSAKRHDVQGAREQHTLVTRR